MAVKVLFVNYFLIGDTTATGITMHNIFSGMPDCDILQYCLCTQYSGYARETDVVFAHPKDSLINSWIGQKHQQLKKLDSNTDKTSKRNIIKRAKKLIERPKQFVLMLNDMLPFRVNENVYQKIKDFNPDVIYTLGGAIKTLKTANTISELFNIPIVLHHMDDIISTKYTGWMIEKPARRMLLNAYGQTFNNSVVNIAIGPKMAEEYTVRFGLPHVWAMNCVDKIKTEIYKPQSKTVFMYAGGLHSGRWKSLQTIARCISQLSCRGHDVELHIYTSLRDIKEHGDALRILAVKRLLHIPHDQIDKHLALSDVLVHVESFETKYRNSVRLSMSTKIPEYLSSGRALMYYGPQEIASFTYIQQNEVGWCADNENDLYRVLEEAIIEINKRKEFASNAQKVAIKNHIKESVQLTVRDTLLLSKNSFLS